MKRIFNRRQQIAIVISLALIVPPALIGFTSVYRIQQEANAEIEQFRAEELSKLKRHLKYITDIAYGILEVSHQSVRDSSADVAIKVTLDELSHIRFDKREGYFWVTDNKVPFPTMLMHAEKPELNGVILDDPRYNVEKHQGRNIYQVRAELSNLHGEAYVEYIMRKPGTREVFNKISYSRLYRPLGWVISTGSYTDHIEAAVSAKKNDLRARQTNILMSIVIVVALALAAGTAVARYFSTPLMSIFAGMKNELSILRLAGTRTPS